MLFLVPRCYQKFQKRGVSTIGIVFRLHQAVLTERARVLVPRHDVRSEDARAARNLTIIFAIERCPCVAASAMKAFAEMIF